MVSYAIIMLMSTFEMILKLLFLLNHFLNLLWIFIHQRISLFKVSWFLRLHYLIINNYSSKIIIQNFKKTICVGRNAYFFSYIVIRYFEPHFKKTILKFTNKATIFYTNIAKFSKLINLYFCDHPQRILHTNLIFRIE